MTRRSFIALVILLAACSPISVAPTATEPVPVVPTNTVGGPLSTEATAPTVAPTVSTLPLEAIWIASPGAGSTVTSPLTVEGQSRPTFEQNLVLAVYGEDGTLLAMQPTTIAADAGSPGPFSTTIEFNVDHGQPGRVVVYESSAMDGGIIHLVSSELTLLPAGEVTNIVAAPAAFENMSITPPAGDEIRGGSYTVTGISEYYFESQLGLLLCASGGGGEPDDLCGTADNILASSVAMIASPDMGQPGPFSGTLNWSVTAATPGRIVVYAASPRDGGLVHVTSIPVTIQP